MKFGKAYILTKINQVKTGFYNCKTIFVFTYVYYKDKLF